MGTNAIPKRTVTGRDSGFSLLEMILALAIVLILAAISLPDFARAYRIYQLNSSATRLAALLKLTRFDAIRRNTQVSFQVQQTGTDWLAWDDLNNNGVADTTETQAPVIAPITLLPAGGGPPSPDAIVAPLGGHGLTVLSGGNATVAFDARGAVIFGGPLQIYAFYFGNTAYPDYGYRAVVLLPTGATQVWSAPVGGPWTRVG